jgi:predicted DNA-binding protein
MAKTRGKYKKLAVSKRHITMRVNIAELVRLDALAKKLGVTRTQVITELLFRKHQERWERYEMTVEGQREIRAIHACLSEVSQRLLRKTEQLKPERISMAKYAEVADITKRLYDLIYDLQLMVKKRA